MNPAEGVTFTAPCPHGHNATWTSTLTTPTLGSGPPVLEYVITCPCAQAAA